MYFFPLWADCFRISEDFFCDLLQIKLVNENSDKDKIPIIIGDNFIVGQKLKNIYKPFDQDIKIITKEDKTIGYLKVSIRKSFEKF